MSDQIHFAIIGAQKAGTSLVQLGLRSHPSIFMPNQETPFFEDPDYAADRLCTVLCSLAGARLGQIAGIKRPNYFARSEVPSRLAHHFLDLKLILILREPISRAISAYFHLMQEGLIPLAPLDVGMQRILDGEYDHWPSAPTVLTYGLYGRHLTHWRRFFPRHRFCVERFDVLTEQTSLSLSRMYRFLDVEDVGNARIEGAHPKRGIYSIPSLRVVRMLGKVGRRYTHGHSRIDFRGWQGKLGRFTGGAARSLLAFQSQPPPQLPEAIRCRLVEYYSADLELLTKIMPGQYDDWLHS